MSCFPQRGVLVDSIDAFGLPTVPRPAFAGLRMTTPRTTVELLLGVIRSSTALFS